MKALSIRQPWAWLIVHGGKDVENRTWQTQIRGRFLVHASQGMSRQEYFEAAEFARSRGVTLPAFDALVRGGIIGSVELYDCALYSPSPWYMGEVAWALRDPMPLPFTPMKGRLRFFNVGLQALGLDAADV